MTSKDDIYGLVSLTFHRPCTHTHYHFIISAYNLWCNIFPVPIILDIYTQYFFQISPLPGDRLGMVSRLYPYPPQYRVQWFYTLQISSCAFFISLLSYFVSNFQFYHGYKRSITFSYPKCQKLSSRKLYKLLDKLREESNCFELYKCFRKKTQL
jgi:hypothetical protein